MINVFTWWFGSSCFRYHCDWFSSDSHLMTTVYKQNKWTYTCCIVRDSGKSKSARLQTLSKCFSLDWEPLRTRSKRALSRKALLAKPKKRHTNKKSSKISQNTLSIFLLVGVLFRMPKMRCLSVWSKSFYLAGKLTKVKQHDALTTSCHHCQMNK